MASIPVRDGLMTTAWPRGLRVSTPADAGFDPARLEAAFSVLEQGIAKEHIPGAVAVIARHGKVAAHRALGWAAVEPERRPMQPDTLFDMASLTKVMATLPSVLRLLEQGAFRLDDPLQLFFPNYNCDGREDITIRHLITHTGGFPPGTPHIVEPASSREERIDRIASVPLQEKPGTRIIYTDLGFILLGELITRVTGKSVAEFARDEIFTPLGLKSAGYCPQGEAARTAAATEYRDYLGRYQCGEVHDENSTSLGGVAGHAGLFATAADVAAYGQMWLDGGAGVLSPATVAAATMDQTPHVPDADHRGFGWIVSRPGSAFMSCGDLFAPGSFGHTGFTGTSVWMDPTRGLVVALLTNRVHFGRQPHILRLRPRFHNAVAAALV